MNTLILIDQFEKQIANLFTQIESKQHEIAIFEYSCTEEQFNEFLDEVHSEVEVMGMTYSASYALKELDPIAYRCAKLDYESNFDVSDCEEYQDLQSELDELESQLDDLESQLDDLQSELDDLESED